MDELLKGILVQVAIYILIALAVLFLLNFQSVGFLAKWLSVKSSRGKKVLIRVRSKVQDYYRSGEIQEGFLIFKGLNKETRRLHLPDEGSIYRSMGVNNISVDDETNSVFKHDLKGVSGFDAEKMDDLYVRALMKPAMLDNTTKIILIILIVLVIGLAHFVPPHFHINQGAP